MLTNKQPLISIITVVYNGAKTIDQTISSVLNQTYRNIEYIIIDGGSTDGTLDIVKKYDKEIALWISEPDKGLYDAMNKGIIKAKGELIGMINSDDWYEPNAVELVVNAYIENPEKRIFHGDRYDVLKDGTKKLRRFNPSRLKFIFYGMTYNHPSMFVHRDIYEKNIYDTSLRVLSDYEFVLWNFLNNRNMFNYIPSVYVNYRLEGLSTKIKFCNSLSEGFFARKNAGLSFVLNIFSFIFRLTVRLLI